MPETFRRLRELLLVNAYHNNGHTLAPLPSSWLAAQAKRFPGMEAAIEAISLEEIKVETAALIADGLVHAGGVERNLTREGVKVAREIAREADEALFEAPAEQAAEPAKRRGKRGAAPVETAPVDPALV